ncbi:latrophilin Cirl-like isoform X2 [Tachypleus tridentatus]|uniref:latrophilin Cirl-like isoform X2 n=1 Tax=Tachypleus tridentatus TaxID=6853 RepID=UPI003FD2C27F
MKHMMARQIHLRLVFLILNLMVGLTLSRRGVSMPNFSIRPPLLERYHYTSTYACEGRELKISCNNQNHIRLVRANYGRFSISICNDKGNTDWSVICMSDRSFLIMQDKCSGKSMCSVFVSSDSFGDPCPGTLKYLEVQYHCISPNSRIGANNPTDTAHPIIDAPFFHTFNFTSSGKPVIGPWLNNGTLHPSKFNYGSELEGSEDGLGVFMSSTSYAVTTVSTTEVTKLSSSTAVTLKTLTPLTENKKKGKENENVLIQARIPLSTVVPQVKNQDSSRMCLPVTSHNLSWNWTTAGETKVQNCPGGATGFAKWRCSMDVKWTPKDPDLKECKSVWVDNLRERMHGGDSVNSIAREMALMTLTRPLFSKDITHVTSMIHLTLRRALNNMDSYLDIWRRHQTFKELLESIVETVSNLLEDKQNTAWLDMSKLERKQVASHLLQGLEESAFLLAETLIQENSYLFTKRNVLLSVLIIEVKHSRSVVFPLKSDISGTSWIRHQDSLFLPAQVLLEHSSNGLARVILQVYNKMDELLQPGSGFQSPVIPVDKATKNISWTINSRIVAASVGSRRIVQLSEPVIVSLKHIQEENVTNPHCVYWDLTLREWSGEGCWVKNSSVSYTVCACNHLTNFAVLMEIKPPEMIQWKNRFLEILNSVSCALCCLFLLTTITALHVTKSLHTDAITIHKNLCICLLGTELIFAAGVGQTHIRVLCGIIAGLLHYFLLVVFAWVFVESFHLYVLLIEVYESEKSRAIWYHGLAYGVPIVIVAISAIVDPYSYGTKDFCWLQTDNYFIFSFVGPAVGILFGSAVFLCIATCILCHHSGIKTMVKGKEEAKLSKIKISITWTSIVLVSLSSTWTAGLLYISQSRHILAYIFSIFNCIMGILIFLFYCIKNERMKEEIQTYLQRLKWFPESLRQSKNQEQAASLPITRTQTTTPQLSVINQQSNSQNKTFTISQKFTTEDHPTTTINQEDKILGKRGPATGSLQKKEFRGHAQLPKAELSSTAPRSGNNSGHSASYGFTANSLIGAWHYSLQDRHKHLQQHHYSNSSDKYSAYSEHIYESIDNDTLSSLYGDYRHYPQAGHHGTHSDFYGEHSDHSQHSSSSGYDQHPLLVSSHTRMYQRTPLVQSVYGVNVPQKNFSLTSTPELPWQNRENRAYGSYFKKMNCDRLSSAKSYNSQSPTTHLNSDVPLEKLQLHADQEHSEWTTATPDLLHVHPDNVVMAVLEGEKVVSRLHLDSLVDQGNEIPQNLSTYC